MKGPATLSAPAGEKPLRDCVRDALAQYFHDLDGHLPAGDLYALVTAEVERPMLEAVLAHTGHNQCRAAEILGINRGTLRKKLQKYDIEKS